MNGFKIIRNIIVTLTPAAIAAVIMTVVVLGLCFLWIGLAHIVFG